MNVLVTGATSKAGVEVAKRLRAAGAKVRTTVHLKSDRSPEAPQGSVAVDFALPESLAPAFSEVDKAVFIIPESSAMGGMTANLVSAAESAGLTHLLLVSFLHADQLAGGPVLAWHLQAEQVVRASAVPSTCLRPNFYMQNFLSAYPPAASLGGGNVSYIDAADVAEVVALILLEGGHEQLTYSLTGPRALPIEAVAALLRGEVGPPLTYGPEAREEACTQRRRSSMSAHLQALCEFWAAAGEERFADVTPDFQQLTGRAPRSFESFAQAHRGELRALRASRGTTVA